MGRRGEALRAVRPRRGASRAHDGRRLDACLPSRHARCLVVLRRRVDHRPGQSEPAEGRHVLGARDRPGLRRPCARARLRSEQRGVRAEHDHRRCRRRRTAGRAQASPASGVRHRPGRLRRSRAEEVPQRSPRICRCSGQTPGWRRSSGCSTSSESSSRSRANPTSRPSASSAGSRVSTSRSTSCPGCSTSSARTSSCTTVEGLPLLGLPTAKLLPFSRTIKRAIDIVGATICSSF